MQNPTATHHERQMRNLDLISIAELFGIPEVTRPKCDASIQMNRHFSIPAYQRGYRWTVKQVEALLRDVLDFNEQRSGDVNAWYSLQPLVVAARDGGTSWEVVDGQQRLTTLWLILKAFGIKAEELNEFSITYETRPDSWSFLRDLTEESNAGHDVDADFMMQAYITVTNWIKAHKDKGGDVVATIRTKCKLIWYEVDITEAKKTFERLNTGKIPLTSSELIKALYMVSDNEISEHEKMEISKEWEVIENTLRDDRFWYMLHTKESPSATRIDFLFDWVAGVEITPEDENQTFRAFEEFSREDGKLLNKWQACRDLFWQFQGWYEDFECYHYVGFLRMCSVPVNSIIAFKTSDNPLSQRLAAEVIKKVHLEDGFSNDEKKQFGYATGAEELRRLFVLLNIETLNIRHREQKKQLNGTADDVSRYLGYERFPFDLYYIQQWDIEHVSSQTDNPLTTRKDQKEWLEASRTDIKDDCPNDELWQKVQAFIDRQDSQPKEFDELWQGIRKLAGEDNDSAGGSHELGNLTLLDCGTNRSYKNKLFPTKRRIIIERDKAGLYIPICTKHLFLKYYTAKSTPKISRWDERSDGAGYVKAIKEVMQALYENAGKGYAELPDLLKKRSGESS